MRVNRWLALTLKLSATVLIMLLAYMVSSVVPALALRAPATAQESHPQAGSLLLDLLLVSFLQAGILSFIILRSKWTGRKLMGATFLLFYGVTTVTTQLESIVFLPTKMPRGMIPALFLMGAVVAIVFAPSAVLILGGAKAKEQMPTSDTRLAMPASEWAWKLAVNVVVYEALYFGFGYFVAWQDPAVREYYGGTDPGSFLKQIAAIWSTTPWLFLFQAFRAVLWTAFAVPAIRAVKGKRWERSLTMALAFPILASALLLIPNPYMPVAVERVHLIETSCSNFIFGWIVGWLLSRG